MSSSLSGGEDVVVLNPAWGVMIEPGSPEPYVLLRLDPSASGPTVLSRIESYKTARSLFDEMRDRIGKVDRAAFGRLIFGDVTRHDETKVQPEMGGWIYPSR